MVPYNLSYAGIIVVTCSNACRHGDAGVGAGCLVGASAAGGVSPSRQAASLLALHASVSRAAHLAMPQPLPGCQGGL